jgi:tetratricopeptide (TPR) repeat protein
MKVTLIFIFLFFSFSFVFSQTKEDYLNYAKNELQSRNYQKAIEYCTKAISLDVLYEDAYFFRGNAYLFLEDYDNAMFDYYSVTYINPNSGKAYNNIGTVYQKKGYMKDACESWEKAYSLGFKESKEQIDTYCK